jgi:hypothetical protein
MSEAVLKCPKCGAARPAGVGGPAPVCGSCGLVFAKWTQRALGVERLPAAEDGPDSAGGRAATAWDYLTYVEPRTDAIVFWGRVALWCAFALWGGYFIALDFRNAEIMQSFMHRIDLVFHEAGHIIFMPFGHFMMVLGGTLGQLLMPLVVMTALVWKNRDNFGGAIGLWWFGQSLMDCAPYINDARALQLPLLGGGTGADRPGVHDWENILLDLNLIHRDHQIAAAADGFGSLLVVLGLAWGAWILLLQYRNLPAD